MRISQIMTRKPVTVPPETDLDDALQLMDDEDVRHLPVTDGARLVGVVSDRDLLAVLGWVPARTAQAKAARGAKGPRRVADVMHEDVTVVSVEDDLAAAAAELLLQRIGCVLVLDEGRLAGIVTEMDVLAAFHRHARHKPGSDPPVSQLMTTFPTSVDPDTPLLDALEACRDLKARHLPVLEDGRLVGVLSDRDLRAAVGQGSPNETPVSTIMSRQVVTLEPDDRSSRAAELMVENRFSSVPVVVGGALAGLITLSDLLEHALAVLESPGQPS